MKILLVEDELKLAESLQIGLKQEGYIVDILSNGEIAERRIMMDTMNYDLVLLDINLPGRDGLTVCKNIRENKNTVPILMLTARDTKPDIVLGLDVGADDYLVKPFSFEELLARIRAISRRKDKIITETIKTSGLTLNSKTREVTLDNKKIELTPKEFNILELLMSKRGTVVTRETLIGNIWDFSFDSFSNVVDVHIKNLRKKINKHDEILETVRGVGYKIKA